MPPKKPNDEFDLSEFEDLLRPRKAPDSDGFDIPEFSLDDYDLFLETELPELDKPEEEAFSGEDRLELDSFLKFYDEPLTPAISEDVKEVSEQPEESGEEPSPEPEPEPEPEPVKKSRRRKNRALEVPPEDAPEAEEAAGAEAPDEAAEVRTAEEEDETAETARSRFSLGGLFGRKDSDAADEADGADASGGADETDDEEEAERPRFSLSGLFGRRDAGETDEADGEDASGGADETDGEEEAERPRFSLAGLFGRKDVGEADEADGADASEDAEEIDGEEARPRFSLAGLFARRNGEEEAPEETDEADGESPEAAKKPGRLSADKEKLFAMLYPRKKSSEEPEADAAETSTEEVAPAEASKAVQVVPGAMTAQGMAWQDLPREPKAGEMLVLDSELDEIDYYDEEDLPEIRDYMPVRFARYGRLGIGGGIMYALFVISVSVILACAGWLFASDVLALNKPDTTSIVTILKYVPGPEDVFNEDGDPVDEEGNVIQVDIDQVASALKSSGVIEYKWLFKLFAELSTAHAKIDPGTYDVSAKLDYRALVTEMQTGSESQEITRITIPEGYSMDQIFQLLEDNGICEKEDLYEQAANYDFSYEWLEGLPLGDASRLEGYLFPDTYDFYQGESAVNAIDRFLNRFHYILTLDMYTQADNLGISLHEAVIIASLIEKEAGAEDDRSLFSSVIHNRLDDGWKLQLDSTLNYIKGTSTFDLTYEDMEIDSPYNTYLYEGLPAGPICSPGKASLEAALNPSSTNYWYWYAYEGVTYFFSSGSAFDEFAAAHPY